MRRFLIVTVSLILAAIPVLAATQVQSTAVESNHVLKTSAGSLLSVYVTTGGTAGFLMLFDATSAPGDGAVTPAECVVAPASTTTAINWIPNARVFTTGITVVFSSTGCFTKTASATAYFSAQVN